MFITIYGINNIGKSTHARLLVENLKKMGYEAEYVKFPIYDLAPTGPYIDEILRGGTQRVTEEELQLWFALNRHQYERTIRDMLNKNIIVVAEDYIGTAIAWGTAKGADPKWLEHINEHLLEEDLTILMNGELAAHSFEDGHIHEQDDELVGKVRKVFLELAEKKKWKRVEQQKKKADTQKLILDIVKKHLDC